MSFRGVVIAIALAGCAASHGAARTLKAGDVIPDVQVKNQDGALVRLSQYRGHPLVVYFYPKDRTPGWTLEAQAFRSDYAKFRALGAEVVGVSNDDVASHKDFCTHETLPFPLLADTDQTVARAFGVESKLGFYHRMTFLIDGGGVVRRVFDPVKPASHAREVLAALEALAPTK